MGIAPQQGSHRDNKGDTVIPHFVVEYHKTTVRRIIDRCREIILSLMNSQSFASCAEDWIFYGVLFVAKGMNKTPNQRCK